MVSRNLVFNFCNKLSVVTPCLAEHNRRHGVVVRAPTSQPVDLGFIYPSRVIPKDFKKRVFTASLLGAQHKKQRREQAGKLASCVVGLET